MTGGVKAMSETPDAGSLQDAPDTTTGDVVERAKAALEGDTTTGPSWSYPDDVDYAIDGGWYGIYDGVIVWVLTDGRRINRFRGEGSRREARVDRLYPECEAYR